MFSALRDMALFVEVAKAKSFARAAEASGVPKSTLSRRIAELEREIGLQLFNRNTRAVDLTEAGAVYFGRCREIIGEAELAHASLKNLVVTPRGTLRISMTPDFATAFVAPLCVKFAGLHPEVNFDLDLSPTHVDLITENFDLAIRIGKLKDSELITRHLCTVHTGLFATPGFIKRYGTPSEPRDLSSLPCIANPSSTGVKVWRLERGNKSVAVTVGGRFKANNPGVSRRLALLGEGIIVLDEVMASQDLAAGRLKRILPQWSLPPVPVTALTPSRLQPAKTRAFLDFLIQELKPLGSRQRSGL